MGHGYTNKQKKLRTECFRSPWLITHIQNGGYRVKHKHPSILVTIGHGVGQHSSHTNMKQQSENEIQNKGIYRLMILQI